jgi:glutamate-1-semialdehyde 2,1-aminomutase
MSPIDRSRLASLIERERSTYTSDHPTSAKLFGEADHLFGRVPMTWMAMWSGGFPLYLDRASGNRVTDVDGREYVDFALGDTGAMAGHSPRPTVEAVTERIGSLGGITTMLPTADAEWVGAELTRRFGLPLWSFTLTATDANRWAIRLARLATGKPKILTFAYCYHGSVDEAFAVPGPDGTAVARPGLVGAPVPLSETTRVAEFNDLAGVEAQLAHGDVAAILTEPALTNIGIVLPEPGFMEGLRELATRYGALLMIDETHTFSAGPGGATCAWGLQPDIFVIGKSIGGGIPSGAYGISRAVAEAVNAHPEADLVDVGGVGGTLAGNALSVAAMRATLEHVLTEGAFAHMGSPRFTPAQAPSTAPVRSVSQLGARPAPVRLPAPATAAPAAAADNGPTSTSTYLANRGVLITPFHNMALSVPTRARDVALHTLFAEAKWRLVGP